MRTVPVAIALLCAVAFGQVPVGQAVNGSISTTNPLLAFVDRAGLLTRVTGASLPSFNAVAIDPIDGDLWLGAWQSGAVRRARLSGSSIVSEPLAVTVPISSVAAIAFDVNGHALAVGGSPSTTGGVFRIDRNTGAVTRIFGGPASGLSGTLNAAETDPLTGDLYLGLAVAGQVWRLTPPLYDAPVLIGTASGITTIAGLTVVRNPAMPLGAVFLACFGTAGNNSLQSIDLASGTVSVIPGVPALPDLNWVDYDDVAGDLWMNGTAQSRRVMLSTLTGSNTLLGTFSAGSPASIEVNDVRVDTATLTIAPRYLPTPTAAINLEFGVAGNPGELAVVAITSPFMMVLGSGIVDGGGRFDVSFPGFVMQSGFPGFAQFLAGTLDPTTLALKLSSPVAWPAN